MGRIRKNTLMEHRDPSHQKSINKNFTNFKTAPMKQRITQNPELHRNG